MSKVNNFSKVVFLKKTLISVITAISVLGGITGILGLFEEVSWNIRISAVCLTFALPLIYWIVISIKIIKSKNSFTINGNKIKIEKGDIFNNVNNDNAVTVINFDSRFNTRVDDVVITKGSIHGQYINKYWSDNIDGLNKEIEKQLANKIVKREIKNKKIGNLSKQRMYQLGEYVLINNNVMLLGFSNLNEEYKSKLEIDEYFQSLIAMWNNLDCCYNDRDIYLALPGSGITRMEVEVKNPTDLLLLTLESLKISRIPFHHNIKIHIMVLDETYKEIDFLN